MGATAPALSSIPRETAVSRQQLHITLAGRELVVDAGTTAGDAFDQYATGGDPPPAP